MSQNCCSKWLFESFPLGFIFILLIRAKFWVLGDTNKRGTWLPVKPRHYEETFTKAKALKN
jgi:hypothetical protein